MMYRDLPGKKAAAASQFEKEREYWLCKLGGEWEKTCFPPDPRLTDTNAAGRKTAEILIEFSQKLVERLLQVSNHSDPRLYMLLMTGLILLVYKYIGKEDIIIGTTIDKQEMQGEFINTLLPIRMTLNSRMTFRQLLKQTRETIVKASENQNYPIETLPYELQIPFPDDGDFPLFDMAMLLENIQDKQYLRGIHLNMVFSFKRTGQTLEGVIEYNAYGFEKSTLERIAQYYPRLLQISLAKPDTRLSGISFLSEPEKRQLLIDFNSTFMEYPRQKTLHQLFREQSEKSPDSTAVLEAEGDRNISYRELQKKADQWANVLVKRGVRTGWIIPIMGQRTIEITAGILGILQSGGAYLPIDGTSPPDRIKFLLQDSSAVIILTQRHLIDQHLDLLQVLPPGNAIAVDEEYHYFEAGKVKTWSSGQAADPAYVIYTSGTTGRPKGVVIRHFSVVNYLTWAARMYVKNESVNFPLYTSISFDMTITSLFTPLITGNVLVLYKGQYNQLQVERIVAENPGGVLKLTPSHLRLMADRRFEDQSGQERQTVKRLIVGGEQLDRQLALEVYRKFEGKVEIYNEYGPTEATVGCMIYRFDPSVDHGPSVPIGVPAGNSRVYLLDKNLEPVPLGVIGEIYIGGDGVAAGYLNHPELTAEKFILAHSSWLIADREAMKGAGKFPMSYELSAINYIYRTGDLARWLSECNIEFLGRMDFQVKVRGFRIEPGEIENRLVKHPGIKEALVLPRQEKNGDKYLCAYIVPQPAVPIPSPGSASVRIPEVSALRESLARELPDYMIPAFFVQLEKMPLTPSGKIDRKALPEPEVLVEDRCILPRTKTEQQLADLWSDVLGVEKKLISVNSNFFEIGGHSLKATVLIARIYKWFDVKLSLANVFENSTIQSLSRYIDAGAKVKYYSIEPVEKKEYYILSSAQKRLYVLQNLDQESTSYNISQLFEFGSDLERENLKNAFIKLIQRHDSLRTSFVMVNEEPVQRVHEPEEVEFEIEYHIAERRAQSAKRKEERHAPCAMRHASTMKNFIRPFDLSTAPLLRVRLIPVEENRQILLVDMHHIISDGVSYDILVKEFMSFYQDKSEELLPLRLQYKDFSGWQNSPEEKEITRKQEQYWLKEFEGEIPVLKLPTDYARPEGRSFEGSRVEFCLGRERTRVLKRIALEENATMNMVSLAIFYVLLSKVSGQEDIVVGIAAAGRGHADLEPIIGMFVNMLAIRTYPRGEKTFKSFLPEVIHTTTSAYENQDYPFNDLVEKVVVHREMNRHPLFDVGFALQNQETPGIEASMVKPVKNHDYEIRDAKFDMLMFGVESAEDIIFILEYNTNLFKQETMERFFAYYQRITDAVISNSHRKIKEIEVITAEENLQMLSRKEKDEQAIQIEFQLEGV